MCVPNYLLIQIRVDVDSEESPWSAGFTAWETMDLYTKKSQLWDLSVWTTVVDRTTDQQIQPASVAKTTLLHSWEETLVDFVEKYLDLNCQYSTQDKM